MHRLEGCTPRWGCSACNGTKKSVHDWRALARMKRAGVLQPALEQQRQRLYVRRRARWRALAQTARRHRGGAAGEGERPRVGPRAARGKPAVGLPHGGTPGARPAAGRGWAGASPRRPRGWGPTQRQRRRARGVKGPVTTRQPTDRGRPVTQPKEAAKATAPACGRSAHRGRPGAARRERAQRRGSRQNGAASARPRRPDSPNTRKDESDDWEQC